MKSDAAHHCYLAYLACVIASMIILTFRTDDVPAFVLWVASAFYLSFWVRLFFLAFRPARTPK
jgi:hypothetical protein